MVSNLGAYPAISASPLIAITIALPVEKQVKVMIPVLLSNLHVRSVLASWMNR